MKKTVSLLLIAVIILSLCSCKNPSDSISNGKFPNLNSFDAKTIDGMTFNEYSFAGYDLTVVNIWGTYCSPCREEMPQLAAFANSLPSNIQFITICVDASGNTQTAKQILANAGYKGVTLVSGSGDYKRLLNKIQYIPTTVFIDSQGNCVGEEIIGGQSDFSAVYTQRINEILSEMNKPAI